MQSSEIQEHLRLCGVVVHLVTLLPCTTDRPVTAVVFLEATLGQHEMARAHALRLPDVSEVTFSDHSTAIMYLALSRAGSCSCAGQAEPGLVRGPYAG